MFLKSAFLCLVGLSFGMMVSGGVFTVLISVGLIPRFAGKTHTSRKVFLYEEMVVFGTLVGNMMSLYDPLCRLGKACIQYLHIPAGIWYAAGNVIVVFFGLFAGHFVGCLALAIAEMLDTIPIFARRIGFRHGLGIAVLSIALGKMAGSLLYFWFGIYLYGG